MIVLCGRTNLAWDAAHRVRRHESKCRTLHGHRYTAEVVCRAYELDDVDRVVDFGVIKEKLGAWIDEKWDHTTIVGHEDADLLDFAGAQAHEYGHKEPYVVPGEPTAETLAAYLFGIAKWMFTSHRIEVVEVTVWETPNCYATARRE